MLEREYQAKLIKKLRRMFSGSIILKNDSEYLQGVPDLVIFYGPRYAFLEVKASDTSRCQPNQMYYIEKLNEMSFASIISPSNEQEVLNALWHALHGIQLPSKT